MSPPAPSTPRRTSKTSCSASSPRSRPGSPRLGSWPTRSSKSGRTRCPARPRRSTLHAPAAVPRGGRGVIMSGMDDHVTEADIQATRDRQNRLLYNLLLEVHPHTPPHLALDWVAEWDAEAR